MDSKIRELLKAPPDKTLRPKSKRGRKPGQSNGKIYIIPITLKKLCSWFLILSIRYNITQYVLPVDFHLTIFNLFPSCPKGGRLWRFMLELLQNNEYNPSIIQWEKRQQGVFRIVKSSEVARLWGQHNRRPKMNYEKLSRALRLVRHLDLGSHFSFHKETLEKYTHCFKPADRFPLVSRLNLVYDNFIWFKQLNPSLTFLICEGPCQAAF